MKTRVFVIGALFTLLSARAGTCTWINASSGNTPATAYDWSDSANWKDGAVPADGDAVVFPQNGGVYFVRMPDELKLGGMNVAGNARLLGERLVITDLGLNTRATLQGGGVIYADIQMGQPGDVMTTHYLANINLAGRIVADVSEVISAWSDTLHRLDFYATTSDPLRTDDFQLTKSMHPGSGNVGIYAPEGAEACTGTWSQTAGSPYLQRVSATAHPIAVGTLVTGAGIPEGAFVRRRFGNNHIELSAPVTETVAENAVAFAAFTPDVRAHIPLFDRQGTTQTYLKLFKYRAQDGFRFEMDNMRTGPRQLNTHGLTAEEIKSRQPGTEVVHAWGGGGDRWEQLRNCHFEFIGTTIPAADPVCFLDGITSYEARMTVPADAAPATIGMFTNWTATVVKDGPGTLTVGLGEAVNAGAAVVASGTLALTRNAAAGEAVPSFGRIAVAAGATLQLPACGLSAAVFEAASGAVVSGPGELVVSDFRAGTSLGAVQLVNGATLRLVGGTPGAHVPDTPAANVIGHPAFWLDASKPESLVYETENGTNFVTRWNDWREGEPMFCTNIIRRPQLLTGAEMKDKYVRLGMHTESEDYTNTEQLVWSAPLKDIRAVFLVQDPTEGGGEILGRCSWRLDDTYYGSRGGPYYRGGSSPLTRNLISPSYGTPCVTNGTFYLNGQIVNAMKTGYLGGFMQLVEHHVNTNYPAHAPHRELWCDAFGAGYVNNPDGGRGNYVKFSNGGMRIAEYVIYTNSLTYAERVQVAQYLSRKWLGSDIHYEEWDPAARAAASDIAATGAGLDVAAGSTYFVGTVAGDGAFVKLGAGTAHVEELGSGAVRVEAGELVVKSLALDGTGLPENAWLHMDAAKAETLTYDEAGGVKKLARWDDARGTGASLRPLDDAKRGTLVEDALNGLPVIDLGAAGSGAALRCYREDGTPWPHSNNGSEDFIPDLPRMRTAFVVHGSKNGGGTILGAWGNGYPAQGLPHKSTDPAAPVFTQSDDHWSWTYGSLSAAVSNGTATVRMNGARFDPFTMPYSGGYDVFAFRWSTGRKFDSFAAYNQNGSLAGGLEYGEIVVYERALTDAEFDRVEAYLQKKWFNRNTPGFLQAEPASLAVAAGAKLRLEGGALATDGLSGAGTVHGDVALRPEGVLTAEVRADGTIAGPLTVTGAANLSKGGEVELAGAVEKLAVGSYPLVAASPLTLGGVWTCASPRRDLKVSLVKSGDAAVLRVMACGTLLLFR